MNLGSSRAEAPLDGSSPLPLSGYGAYGESLNAEFELGVLLPIDGADSVCARPLEPWYGSWRVGDIELVE